MSTIVILTAIVISGNEIIIITMITKKNLKTSTTAWFSVNIFSENISSWPSREVNFFLMALFQILFLFYKEKKTLPSSNVLLSVMSLVIILLKKFFSPLINFAQRLRCLLYAFLPKSLFAFKNFFSDTGPCHHFFICFCIHEKRLVGSNIPLFYGSVSLTSFIKSSYKSIKLKTVVLTSHLNNFLMWNISAN